MAASNRGLMSTFIARPRLLCLLAALLLLALVSGGCIKKPYKVKQDPYSPGQVQIAENLPLVFDPPKVTYDEQDLMHVSLQIRAATHRPQIIQYRTQFFDKRGEPIYTTQWRTETLESNIHQTLTSVSTSPEATDFKIDVRHAR